MTLIARRVDKKMLIITINMTLIARRVDNDERRRRIDDKTWESLGSHSSEGCGKADHFATSKKRVFFFD